MGCDDARAAGSTQRSLEKAREDSKRKSYFLNAISHDLRTPLNALMLQASLAEVGWEFAVEIVLIVLEFIVCLF